MVKKELLKIKTADGEYIALWKIHAESPKGNENIFLTHGTFSNRKVLLRISVFLAEKGYTCWIMEWRSHGKSSVAKEKFNYETISDYDVPAAFDYLFEEEGILHLSCLSHSGGGFILSMFLIKNKKYIPKIKSMVFFGCQVFGTGYNFRNYCMLFFAKSVTSLLGTIPAKYAGAKEHDASHYMMKQWYDWNLNKNFLGKGGFDYLRELPSVSMPILSISGEGDKMIAPRIACEEFLDHFQNTNNRSRHYSLKNGNLEDYGHSKILNSKNAQMEIWEVALEWMEDGLGVS